MTWFEVPVWETLLRATGVYLFLALALRIVPKRHAGDMSPNDLIALIIVAGLTADAIAVGSTSTPDLLLMIAAVFLWDHVFNVLEHRFPRFRRIAQDSPTLLIHNGVVLKRNLHRELMTEEELAATLRKKGIEDVAAVRQAVLEVDGHVSIIEQDRNGR